MNPKYLTLFLIFIDVLIAIGWVLQKNYAKGLYWLSAGMITYSTLLMK